MQVCTDEPTSIVLIWKLGRKLNKRGPIFSRDVKIPRERERQVDTSAAYQNGPVGPTWPRKSLSLKFFPLVRKVIYVGLHTSVYSDGVYGFTTWESISLSFYVRISFSQHHELRSQHIVV